MEGAVGYFENTPVMGRNVCLCAEEGPREIPEAVSAFGITADIGCSASHDALMFNKSESE